MSKLLCKILSSKKIHLTFTEKNFVKESLDILSIFEPKIDEIFYQKFIEAINVSKNEFDAGKKFLEYIYFLRYPISYPKIKNLKKYKVGLTTDFDETKLNLSEQETKNIQTLLNKI